MMINPELTRIEQIALHRVGNKLNDDGVQISKAPLASDDELNEKLLNYVISAFKTGEYFNFYDDEDLNNNYIFSLATAIFDNPDTLYQNSIEIANFLYEHSVHPKVKKGEFYVVYIKDCLIEDESVDAIGLFKSELKDTFLKIRSTADGDFQIDFDEGINIKKLDKGCMIFNTEKENGYKISVVDNISRGSEAQYWRDSFLKVVQREDDFYFTQNAMTFCKSFVTEKLPEDYNISRADQADLLNKSAEFLKQKQKFDIQEFADEVIEQPELKDSFTNYKHEFESTYDVNLPDEFDISDEVVRKNARVFKSVIKLDKNFHIYVHGKREYIVKGYDEKSGLHFYQLFYKEEK